MKGNTPTFMLYFYENYDFYITLSHQDYVDTWKAMENLVDIGLVKSIGISNFNSVQIEEILAVAEIKPVVNQVECSPALNQEKLREFCKERNIYITAYGPLGHPNLHSQTPTYIFDATVQAIAKKYGKTSAQIVLRFVVSISKTKT